AGAARAHSTSPRPCRGDRLRLGIRSRPLPDHRRPGRALVGDDGEVRRGDLSRPGPHAAPAFGGPPLRGGDTLPRLPPFQRRAEDDGPGGLRQRSIPAGVSITVADERYQPVHRYGLGLDLRDKDGSQPGVAAAGAVRSPGTISWMFGADPTL